MKLLWIGVAGAAGALSRYGLGVLVASRTRTDFPWGTLAVNVSGCFLIGLVVGVLTERFDPHPDIRTVVVAGFLGAYTTFSAFAFETAQLFEVRSFAIALANILANVVAGIAAVHAGEWLAGLGA